MKIKISTILFLLWHLVTYGQGFLPYQAQAPFNSPNTALRVLDFNNDGLDDVITWKTDLSAVSQLWVNNGNSQFINYSNSLDFPSLIGYDFIAYDLDRNGFTDLFAYRGDTIRIFFNSGSNFSSQQVCSTYRFSELAGGSDIKSWSLNDYNDDGVYDFVATIKVNNLHQVVAVPGSAGCNCPFIFDVSRREALLTIPTNFATAVKLLDVDGDSKNDLLIATQANNGIGGDGTQYVNWNYSIYRKLAPSTYSIIQNSGYNLGRINGFGAAGDLNNDGLIDIVSGAPDCCVPGNPLSLYTSVNGLSFTTSNTAIPRVFNPYYGKPSFVDLNLDTRPDISWMSMTAIGNATFQHHRNNGNNTFSMVAGDYGINVGLTHGCCPIPGSNETTLIDFNGDNKPDLDIHSIDWTSPYTNVAQWQFTNNFSNRSIKLGLNACSGVKEGWGARVAYKTGGNWTYLTHSANTQDNYPFLYLGMGTNSTIDSLVVYWKGGATSTLTNISSGQFVRIIENDNCAPLVGTNSSSTNITATITEGESYNFNGQNLTTAGTYTATLQNAAGCDSVVTLNLTVEPAVEPLNCEITANETSVCLGAIAGLNLISNPSNTIPIYQIGDVTPSGGIVFYDKGNDSNGWRYLEVMPVDYSGPTFYTGCYCSSIEGTTNSLGSGYENSQIWASTNCSIVPFNYSYGGFTGWYLPSVAELTQIYTQLSVNNSFSSGAYWSSNPAPYGSCGIDGGASVLNFSNGSVYSEYRNGYQGSGYARLVRRFLPESTTSILWSTGETTPSISVSPTETTTYSVTVTQGGQTCTSEVTITVNQPSAETVNATITEGETYSFNGQSLTTAGTYTATLQNAAGCDSVVTLNLSVNPAPVGGCYASTVINFSQGQRADAANVAAIRSNPEQALGMPEPVVTNVVNFVSLGFGGSITLAFETPIANGAGNDIRIDEATWNNNPCARYPESADVFASQDGSNFVYLGRVCQDAELDLGPLSWAQYVRIVDASDLVSFNADADGYDVNGVSCLNGAATSLNNDGLVACTLQEVVSYQPGTRKNGSAVGAPRNNAANALGMPQNNNTINFVALGFGGVLEARFDYVVFNQPGNELRVTETSFGNPSCTNYPEKARVSVSLDGNTWTELGEICQDGELDLGTLPYAQYIRIQDASPMSSNKFNGSADGFDVDAVVVLNNGCGTSSARLAQMDNTTTPDASMSISAFPNPMEDYTIVNFEGLENDAEFTFQIMDAAGRVIRSNNIRVSTANPTYLFDASELARGIYQVIIANENGSNIIRLVK